LCASQDCYACVGLGLELGLGLGRVDKNHDFLIKIESIDSFDLNQIFLFKSIFIYLFLFLLDFLHYSMLSVITNVLPLSASLWMTLIGLHWSFFFKKKYMCYFYSSLAKNNLQFQPGDAC